MRVTYKCKNCGNTFYMSFSSRPAYSTACPKCGSVASREYKNVPVTKEDESVSGALQTMLYSKKPSAQN